MLDEKIQEVIEMYPIEVTGVSRARGAFICQTTQGLRLLKAYPYAESHLIYESMLKSVLIERGYLNIDSFLYNKEGQLLTPGRDGRNYVMKKWYDGQECDLKDRVQVLKAVKNLAMLHSVMKNIHFECPWMIHAQAEPDDVRFERRSREMRAIRSYIRNKKVKNAFELLYMEYYDIYEGQAKQAGKILEEMDYASMYRESVEGGIYCHGDYSHHHVIMNKNTTAVINFDKSVKNVQIHDLYYFLRKAMEKCNWDISYGMDILNSYDNIRKMTGREKACLYALLLYPEKYWKIANHYYNSRKSWTSEQNMNKMKKFTSQTELRAQFLEKLKNW